MIDPRQPTWLEFLGFVVFWFLLLISTDFRIIWSFTTIAVMCCLLFKLAGCYTTRQRAPRTPAAEMEG